MNQALIQDRRNAKLSLLAASQTKDKDALTEDGVSRVIRELQKSFEYVVCDSPAGIESGTTCVPMCNQHLLYIYIYPFSRVFLLWNCASDTAAVNSRFFIICRN